MKRALLAATAIALISLSAYADQVITPGNGSITDGMGGVWSITKDGVIQKGTTPIPGGAETSQLTIVGGTVYGEDSTGRGWFTLSGDDQRWIHSQPPSGVSSTVPENTAQAADKPTVPSISVPTCSGGPATSAATGAFRVEGGQIIDPNGRPFIARGINVGDDKMSSAVADTGSSTPLLTTFPGINMVRLANGSKSHGADAFKAFVDALTSRGIVVEIEDHPWPLVNAYSGGDLAAEAAWFAGLAKAFADNPYVWFGTQNEPQGGDISGEHSAVYAAIRGAGNNAPIMLDLMGGGVPGNLGTSSGLSSSSYANMKNIVWDFHFYNWSSNYSADQTVVEKNLDDFISAVQQIKGADGVVPVIIGEYGDSTTGQSVDPGAQQVVAAVANRGSTNKNGSLAWTWNSNGGADLLIKGDNTPSDPYGQQVALYIGNSKNVCTKTELGQNASSINTQLTQSITGTGVDPKQGDKADPAQPATTTPSKDQIQSASKQADASATDVDKRLADIQAKITELQNTLANQSTTPSLKAVGDTSQ